jgi:hypothetical protein
LRLGRIIADNNADRKRKKRFGRPYAMGIDVSQGGGDKTVWTVIGKYGVRYVEARETPNTSEIAGRTIRLMRKFGIPDYAVAFDSGGGGKQIADSLRDRGFEGVMDVPFGAASEHPKEYKNMRVQLYGELRKAMQIRYEQSGDNQSRDNAGQPERAIKQLLDIDPAKWLARWKCFALPPDLGDLVRDIAVLPLCYDEEGRMRLPPKDRKGTSAKASSRNEKTIRELLGGRSPDYGDSCALAWHAYQRLEDERAAREIDGDLIYG